MMVRMALSNLNRGIAFPSFHEEMMVAPVCTPGSDITPAKGLYILSYL
jgi:hypothetical protein